MKKLNDALAKLKWPMSEKHLDALLALAMEQTDFTFIGRWRDYSGAVKAYREGIK